MPAALRPAFPMIRSLLLAAGLLLLLAPVARAGVAVDGPREHVRGYVLLVHGGGWTRTGPQMTARMEPAAARLRRWGYGTLNVRYRPGAGAWPDVIDAHDRLRAEVGPRAPICVYGASAGGQMALMLAVRRPRIACVVAHAPPTLLDRLRPKLRRRARVAFGERGGLEAWSPARHRIGAPVLLEHARHDPVVDLAHSEAMHRAPGHSELVVLPPGGREWVHAGVAAAALERALDRERAFLRRATAG